MTKSLGKKIGDAIGHCLTVDVDKRGLAKGMSLRIQVLIDIQKPKAFKKGNLVTSGNKERNVMDHDPL